MGRTIIFTHFITIHLTLKVFRFTTGKTIESKTKIRAIGRNKIKQIQITPSIIYRYQLIS